MTGVKKNTPLVVACFQQLPVKPLGGCVNTNCCIFKKKTIIIINHVILFIWNLFNYFKIIGQSDEIEEFLLLLLLHRM